MAAWCGALQRGWAQVNYVGKAVNLYEDAGYKLSGTSYVINKLLGTSWLWDRVRVSGGAYGGFRHACPAGACGCCGPVWDALAALAAGRPCCAAGSPGAATVRL